MKAKGIDGTKNLVAEPNLTSKIRKFNALVICDSRNIEAHEKKQHNNYCRVASEFNFIEFLQKSNEQFVGF